MPSLKKEEYWKETQKRLTIATCNSSDLLDKRGLSGTSDTLKQDRCSDGESETDRVKVVLCCFREDQFVLWQGRVLRMGSRAGQENPAEVDSQWREILGRDPSRLSVDCGYCWIPEERKLCG